MFKLTNLTKQLVLYLLRNDKMNKYSTTLLLCYWRGFEGRDHFYTILVSLTGRGLEEDIGRYSNFKAYKCNVSVYEW